MQQSSVRAHLPDDGDVSAWLADNGWTQTFPFLADMTEQQVVEQDGDEVYVAAVSGHVGEAIGIAALRPGDDFDDESGR